GGGGAREAALGAEEPARVVSANREDQEHRGPRRRRRARRAREPVQGRPDRSRDRHPLEGHLRGARGRDRRVRYRGASRREHPRQERVSETSSFRSSPPRSVCSSTSPTPRTYNLWSTTPGSSGVHSFVSSVRSRKRPITWKWSPACPGNSSCLPVSPTCGCAGI